MPDDLLAHLDETIICKTEIAAGKIFVSYSRRNRDFAKALYEKLDRMGFTLWRDVHDIEAGAADWWESIKEAIRESETVILCMSLPALKSPVVSDEWLYARSQGKRIIPVVVDEIWDHPDVKTDNPAKWFTISNSPRVRLFVPLARWPLNSLSIFSFTPYICNYPIAFNNC